MKQNIVNEELHEKLDEIKAEIKSGELIVKVADAAEAALGMATTRDLAAAAALALFW